MEEWKIQGVPIFVTRKKIKNLYIRIQPPEARVMVSVPLHISDIEVSDFLIERWDWIEQKRREMSESEKKQEAEKCYTTGERHALWGELHELQVERSLKRPLTELRDGHIYMRVTPHSTVGERRKQLDTWYRRQLVEALEPIILRCENTVGSHAEEWRFRRMKTRWGTCNIQKKRICLNIQLAEKSPDCLEYVVTHELTHFHEASHNKRFWALMDQFYPRWREVRKGMR